jgi:hypothetical protein
VNSLAQQPKKQDSFVSRKVADEVIIVPVRSNLGDLDAIYTLNEVAGRIWELIDGKATLSQISRIVSQEYDISPTLAEGDVIEFLDTLEGAGLVIASPKEE